MADARLGDMLDSAFAAAYDHARGFDHGDPLNCNACAKQRAEILAHVREREVELMALAMYAATYREWLRGKPTDAVNDWRAVTDMTRHELVTPARALRDAYDAAQPGDREA